MDFPKPPQDIELKNIIDKLAQFVARNGPDFEQMTKNKQKGNPKFDFLFGGEYYHYYRHKVNAEQACVNMEMNGPPPNSAPLAPPPPPPPPPLGLPSPGIGNAVHWLNSTQNPVSVEMLTAQQVALNEQIRESETNLNAQHSVLMQQQQYAIDEAVSKAEEAALKNAATECGINFAEFDAVLQPIIDTCTKDAISAGKSWIIQRATAVKTNRVISQYLQRKVIDSSATFNRRLHIIYLLNDTFHHCMRKGTDELKKALEEVLIPMFCTTCLDVNEEQQQKLQKLLNLWENKNNYFSKDIINKLKNPTASLTEYKTELLKKYSHIVEECANNTKNTLNQYQSQHQAFINHALQQIQNLEKQKQMLEQQCKQQQQNITQGSFRNDIPPQLNNSQHQHQTPSLPSEEKEKAKQKPDDIVVSSQLPKNNDNLKELPPVTTNSFELQKNKDVNSTSKDIDDSNLKLNNFNSQDGSDYNNRQFERNDSSFEDRKSVPQSEDLRLSSSSTGRVVVEYFHQSNGTEAVPNSNQYYSGSDSNQSAAAASAASYDEDQPFTRRGQDSSSSLPFYKQGEQPPFPPNTSSPRFNHIPFPEAIPPQLPFNQPPPPCFSQPFIAPDIALPDITRPPPLLNNIPPLMSLPPPEFVPEDLVPSLPYYDLPAGLMVPLVKLEDSEYKPLNPDDIRLPPPAPPSDRLLAAVKAFYTPPGHDRPRDSEGWEKLGLYEYYRAKGIAKQQKADDIAAGRRQKSKTPSPVRRPKSRSRSPPNKKRYRSRSRSKSKGRGSRSPPRRRRSPRRTNRDRRRDRSRSHSLSYSPPPVSDIQRSPTPPSFFGSTYAKSVEKIDETNKGHQILRKMGWGGAGLGLKEQGIEAPISGGEVRDRLDQYKGVGINLNDPYESFRKSKGQAFITRMKERAEERLSSN